MRYHCQVRRVCLSTTKIDFKKTFRVFFISSEMVKSSAYCIQVSLHNKCWLFNYFLALRSEPMVIACLRPDNMFSSSATNWQSVVCHEWVNEAKMKKGFPSEGRNLVTVVHQPRLNLSGDQIKEVITIG